MRRGAAVLGICFAAWPGLARGDTPAPEAPSTAAPAPPSAPTTSPAQPPASAPPSASGTPGAGQIQFAAREHDLGYRAYINNDYDEAANHFENAFFAAPNPAELRSAIRARRDAGELARAATLGAIGQRRFPDDTVTGKVAAEVIALARPHVYEVEIASSDKYSVAIDQKIVAAERVTESTLFMTPGPHQLLVSWSDDRNTRIPIDAREGGQQSLELDPPPLAPPAPVPVPTPAPVPVVVVPPPPVPPPPLSKPFDPAVFIAGAALTAVGAGLIVWSGIDTLNRPGTGTVRKDCSGGYNQSPQCQTDYQDGTGRQLRTNVLIAVTTGVAGATGIIGLFFTQWSPPVATAGVRAAPASGPIVVPSLGIGRAGVEGTF
jgi:hypothetical protein